MNIFKLSTLGSLCAVIGMGTFNAFSAEKPIIHGVADLSHEFSFYSDGRFQKQYLPDQKVLTNWGNLYQIDTSNINLILLLGCDPNVSYNQKDLTFLKNFMKEGGCVLLAGTQNAQGQNKLAQALGAQFIQGAQGPFTKSKNLEEYGSIEGKHFDYLQFKKPNEWTPLITDSKNQSILALRKVGKGCLLIGARQLFGSNPDASDDINKEWITPLLHQCVKNKEVSNQTPLPQLGSAKMGNTKTMNGVTFHYSDYLAPYFKDMVRIQSKTTPLIEKRMGVPLSEGMGSTIGLLSTGGGGFSAGGYVGLAVFWENFPKVEYGMIEFLTHEFVHSWVLPHPEVWNEPIATYVGDVVMGDAGYKEEGDRRIADTIKRASNIDPSMKLYDISGNTTMSDAPKLDDGKKNEIHWGKSFWVFEEMKKLDPNFIAKYFQAKRKFVPKQLDHKYNMDDTVAIISIALKRDMFPWFN